MRSGAGSTFHVDGPATAKLRGPQRSVRVTVYTAFFQCLYFMHHLRIKQGACRYTACDGQHITSTVDRKNESRRLSQQPCSEVCLVTRHMAPEATNSTDLATSRRGTAGTRPESVYTSDPWTWPAGIQSTHPHRSTPSGP